MKLMLALAFLVFSLYVVVSQRQTTLEEFIQVHDCALAPSKIDPNGRKYREYYCADGIGRIGPYYEPAQ